MTCIYGSPGQTASRIRCMAKGGIEVHVGVCMKCRIGGTVEPRPERKPRPAACPHHVRACCGDPGVCELDGQTCPTNGKATCGKTLPAHA